MFLPRAEVKEAMLYHQLSSLKEEMKAKKKLDKIRNEDCHKIQSYMLKKTLEELTSTVQVEDKYAGLPCLESRPSMGA